MKKLLLLVALALAAVPAASAGGWATVGLSSTPDDIAAGGTWSVDLTVLQHGKTPLAGIVPVVSLTRDGGSESLSVTATPTDEIGVFRAVVRFPVEGTWRYEIWDGFSQTHTFAPVEVGPAPSPSSFPTMPAGIALALALAAALALFLRRPRSSQQPAAARN
jgi:MYXO-CTERM domain-containing protein